MLKVYDWRGREFWTDNTAPVKPFGIRYGASGAGEEAKYRCFWCGGVCGWEAAHKSCWRSFSGWMMSNE